MKTNLIEYFLETAQRVPERLAVADGTEEVSFAVLSDMVERCADVIAERVGAKRHPIAVFLPKCTHAIVADLAIVYSGNAYMNMDVKTPNERLTNVLRQAQPELILTNRKYAPQIEKIADGRAVWLMEDLCAENRQPGAAERLRELIRQGIDTDPLCLINTSGSTGTPKCVVLNHRSFFDFMTCAFETWSLEDGLVVGSLSPVIFDIYSFELCLLVARGATMVLIPDEWAMFPIKILELVRQREVSFIFWVPTIMVNIANMGLLDQVPLPSLRMIWFAGEVFPTKQFNVWRCALPDARFVNLYGPIEITLDCTWYEVRREFADDEPLPIGYPCRNTDILILTEENREAAVNEDGELCVRGTSLAMGYYNNPEKTAAAFVQNPLQSAYPELIYRTGDIVCRNTHGEIMFKGRKDSLIKHSGYRIELSEIEHVIVNRLGIVKNGCVLYNHSARHIVLYYEADAEIAPAVFRKQTAAVLPKYMIPTEYRYMSELPRGGTGKIDRARLNREVNG